MTVSLKIPRGKKELLRTAFRDKLTEAVAKSKSSGFPELRDFERGAEKEALFWMRMVDQVDQEL